MCKVEDPEKLILQAKQTLEKVNALVDQLNQLYFYETEPDSKEVEALKAEIKSKYEQVVSLYRKALELKSDKRLWLELGQLLSNVSILSCFVESLSEETTYRKQSNLCYFKAFGEHLKEFPELIKLLGSLELGDFSIVQSTNTRNEIRIDLSTLSYEDIRRFQIYFLHLYLETNPHDADSWIKLANHYAEIGEAEEVERVCDEALEINPNDVNIIISLYRPYEKLVEKSFGEKRLYFLKKEIEFLKKRCELEPNDYWPWKKLAKIYSTFAIEEDAEAQISKAIQYMEEALKRNQNPFWLFWKELGDLYFKKGDKEKAFECYSKALEMKNKK